MRRDWESVLDTLSRKAKVRFSGVAVREVRDSTVVLAFPNDVHRSRCEEFRVEVERAVTARYGAPIGVQYVTDEATAGRAGGAPSGGRNAPVPDAPPGPDPDEFVDLAELTDAPRGGGIIEQLTSAFPGAELIDGN
jgi:hypothetical protein